jgi:hypothetical protein
MRTRLAFASVLLVLATPGAAAAQQQPRGAPLATSLGGYRLGMSRRELPADMPCQRDNAELRQRGNWCTPRPGVGLVVIRDTVAAIWLLRNERPDTLDALAQWRVGWLPRAERAFGRRPDELECWSILGTRAACALESAGRSGVTQATVGNSPVAAWWIGPEDARRARVVLERLRLTVVRADSAPMAEYQLAFVLQCWPGERRPAFTANCIAPPFR